MNTTTTRPADAAPTRRRAPGAVKQILRLTRTEFTLFVRYKTAWMFLALPVFFAFMAMQMPNDEVIAGFGAGDLATLSSIGSISLILGMGHASNVFTARRESLALKRFRVSGVSQPVIFGGVIGVVTIFSLVIAVLIGAFIAAMPDGSLPRDPLMLVLAVVLGGVAFSLMGLLVTPLARNAESAQLAVMVPMMILLFAGGGIIPLEILPENARQLFSLIPSVPPGELVQAAYTGYDVFGGTAGAEPKSYLGLWIAALPSIGLMLAWIAVLALAVRRFFRWDPRQP
ncbi:ABC-2 type transport system permease protein [Nocardiopsis sp. Huas11]|uniref:ABC transporter permease n=1 Tax=Nocardiopsis sp. Huas11 TaxID=2183912 RepID=UPI000EB07AC2|nr:ABC transporter permease [Nocardiopsis sp. Huas11]RKS06231.1 ABC-2 type transport system permease protein [Nocardiopsis sp. Huas11]